MDQITVKNFRCFREKQTARLAPLTLLVGENSTGKTSLMALIRSLWDVAHTTSVADFKQDPYDLGSFDEIVHHRGGRGGRATSFEAGFVMVPKKPGVGVETFEDNNQPIHFEVQFKRRGTVPSLALLRLSQNDARIELVYEGQSWQTHFGTSNGEWKLPGQLKIPVNVGDEVDAKFIILFSLKSRLENKDSDGIPESVSLKGTKLPSEKDWDQIEQIVNSYLARSFENQREQPFASAPVRSKPHRTYDPARTTRDPEGDYIPMYLANVYFQNKKSWNKLKAALEHFGLTSGLFNEILVKPLGSKESGPFQVQIRKAGRRAKGPKRNLIDVGYGVSQVLPVITELLRDDTPPMFLLQQPEVHLHPSAQAALGSLFCQVAASHRQVIVETHSDNLLDRIRMDIRDGESSLKPEDVSILFFERDDLDVRIHSLRIDQKGNILDAPETYRRFFLNETQRSLGL